MSRTFEREYEFDDGRGTLRLSQHEEGDVNCVVWDAALVLAKYLEITAAKNPGWLKNKRTVELGAGLGCVGLVASCCGANVILTDQPKALPLVQHNIEINQQLLEDLNCDITAKSLDWSENVDEAPCELLLMADCVYYSESIEPLLSVMDRITTKDSEILLCQEDRSYSIIQRATWEAFKKHASEIFTFTNIPHEDQHSLYTSNDIWLIRLRKK